MKRKRGQNLDRTILFFIFLFNYDHCNDLDFSIHSKNNNSLSKKNVYA